MQYRRFLLIAVLLASCLYPSFGTPFPSQIPPTPQVPGKSLPADAAAKLASLKPFQVVKEKQSEVEGDLAIADGLGIKPKEIIDPASLEAIAPRGKPFKWVLSTERKLLGLPILNWGVIHSDKDEDIIKHVVATRGRPVLSAGIAKFDGHTLFIDPRSGHYKPTDDSLKLAMPVFKRAGFATIKPEKKIFD
jgi:hypothetical protein